MDNMEVGVLATGTEHYNNYVARLHSYWDTVLRFAFFIIAFKFSPAEIQDCSMGAGGAFAL